MKIAHLNGLRVFETVLRRGSFRAAGEELCVTTAAVGQQIRALEEYLDRQLFIRTSKGVKPCEEARLVKDKLSSCFVEIEDVMAQLNGLKRETRVAVTLPKSFAENWLISHLSEFYRLNTEIDLRLDASNRMVDLVSEDFDFAIRYGPPSDNEIYAERVLFGDYVLPVCSSDFAERYNLSESKKSLEGVPLVHLGQRTPDPKWANWEMWSRSFGFSLDSKEKGPEFNKVSSGLQAAIAGHGLVLSGVTEAYNVLKTGLVVMPFGPTLNCPSGYKYRLISVRGKTLSKLQEQFRDWIVDISEDFRKTITTLLSEGHPLENG
jgi:LysR family glycine cleavage system transcriptional activator